MIITYNTKKEVLVILVIVVGRDLNAIIPARSKTMMTTKIAKTTIRNMDIHTLLLMMRY